MKSYLSALSFCIALAATAFSQTDSAEFFYQKGLKEKQTGRRLESWKNFEKAYRYNPNSKLIVTELANVLLDLRKYGQAREKFLQLEQMGETSPVLYKQLLTLSFNTKQFDDALLYAEKLRTADPNEKTSYYIGRIHYDRDNYGQALQWLQAAEKEDPQNAEIPYLIARSYADMLNYKLSVPYFLKAIEMDTAKSHWVYELGLICYGMHADKEALKYILLAAEKGYPTDNDYMENLGIAYLNVGNIDEGLKIMKEMLAKRPSDMNILNMMAETYYYSGKYKEAINYWDQVLSYDKTNATALYMIGMSYQKKGEREKGMALCDKAIEMDPSLSTYKHKKMQMGF